MKKQIIAAAVAAAVAAPVLAQNATIYGTMDVGYSASKLRTDGANRNITSSGNGQGPLATSVLGVMGTEDLGGGVRAGFHIEYGLNDAASGATLNPNRHSYVFLENSKAGRLVVGQTTSAIHGIVTGFSAGFANNSVGALYTNQTQTNGTTQADYSNENGIRPHTAFQGDMISWTLPKFGNAVARVEYSRRSDDDTAGVTSRTGLGASIRYTDGPLDIGWGYQMRTEENPLTTSAGIAAALNTFLTLTGNINAIQAADVGTAGYDARTQSIALGASYNLGSVQPFLLYTTTDHTVGLGAGDREKFSNREVTEFGLRIPMGATTLFGSIYNGDINYSTVGAGNRAGSAGVDGWQVGAVHALSKRTALYAIHGNQSTGNDGNTENSARVDSKNDATSIGIRHTF